MLTALTNLYNSLPNQYGVIDGGMVNVQQRDGSFKEERYNFKNDGLWAFISRFWYNYDEIEFTQNRDNVLHVIDTYLDKMKSFRDAIADFDEKKIESLIKEANKIKKIIR